MKTGSRSVSKLHISLLARNHSVFISVNFCCMTQTLILFCFYFSVRFFLLFLFWIRFVFLCCFFYLNRHSNTKDIPYLYGLLDIIDPFKLSFLLLPILKPKYFIIKSGKETRRLWFEYKLRQLNQIEWIENTWIF